MRPSEAAGGKRQPASVATGSFAGAYADLLDEVSAALFLHDPLGLHLDEHTGEYDALATAVLARLRTVNNRWDAAAVIHAACADVAGATRAGRPDRYRDLAGDVWEAWARYIK